MTYIREGRYPELTEGRYTLEVVGAEEGTTKDEKKILWRCRFRVLQGPSNVGREFGGNIFEWQIAEVAKACRMKKVKVLNSEEMAYDLHPMDLMERVFLVTVSPVSSGGKVYNNFGSDWEEVIDTAKKDEAPF